jgi:hypothetical protein
VINGHVQKKNTICEGKKKEAINLLKGNNTLMQEQRADYFLAMGESWKKQEIVAWICHSEIFE